MKFTVTFKSPDAFDTADVDDEDVDEAKELFDRFVEYGEYVTVEFDTETQTAKVVE